MGPVDLREQIPEWAQRYAVGDEIAFRHSEDDEIHEKPVAGFSTRAETEGLPVVDADDLDGFADYGTVVIPRRCHVPPNLRDELADSTTC
jgi:hypothetical protein